MNGRKDEARACAEVAGVFLRLGLTAFGGPAAHIALMRAECVECRRWLSEAEFLDLLGASNLIPGPSSTELAIHIGRHRAGVPGLIVAGLGFILPAALLVSACAWAYVRFGHRPQAAGVLYGVEPVVVAIIAQALWALGRTALRTRPLAVLALLAAVLDAAGVNALAVLLGAGALPGLRAWQMQPPPRLRLQIPRALIALPAAMVGLPLALTVWQPARLSPARPLSLFLVFLKIGSVLYGSGYVLLAFLRADLVTRLHWLTPAQLLDATAVGQFTPGPVFTTATFIGWVLAGPAGAAAATVGIFLPAFLLVALSGPLVPRLRRSPVAAAALDGVNAASLALMAVVSVPLARAALTDGLSIALAAVSLLLLVRGRVNAAWLVMAGAALGLLARG